MPYAFLSFCYRMLPAVRISSLNELAAFVLNFFDGLEENLSCCTRYSDGTAVNSLTMPDDQNENNVPRVSVLLPLALPAPYDYEAPAEMRLAPGDYVAVPLGARRVVGVVWGTGSGEVAKAKLKPVLEKFEAPPMPAVLRQFVEWVAGYTLSPRGMVLRLALRAPGALKPPEVRVGYRLGDQVPDCLTPARCRVLEIAGDGFVRRASELAKDAGVSTGVVRGLAGLGALAAVEVTGEAPFAVPDAARAGMALNEAQAAAADDLRGRVTRGGYSVVLLDGVTGSGKTEVYFEAVAAALAQGRQVLILVPEIALTQQFLGRFEARFGCRPAEWHSDLSARERQRTWRAVAEGRVQALVGARSALFLPFPDLGLMIVDEEHEAAFKQEDGVCYHARDMAVVRASLGGFPLILSSATPSLETLVNVEQGRYDRLVLPERHGAAGMPDVRAIDMRAEPPERGRWLAPALVREMAATLAAGEQTLLFLNRRGYAPLTLCRTCGHRLDCPQCDAWLVEHRFRRELICHHCGYHAPVPRACPSCGASDMLTACGPGVERIAEEVAERFPKARCAVVSSDSLGPSAHQEIFDRLAAGDLDILIGTQIVAKGHHFPMLTLVGVVDADLGLENGDLRAGERTYQLLHQVSGRAGRAGLPGRVLLQTFMPEHGVMQALIAGDRATFFERETVQRQRAGLPPFGLLVGLVVSGTRPAQVHEVARTLARAAPRAEGVSVLGPAPAPMALLRGRTRVRFLIKAARNIHVQAFVTAWLERVKIPHAVRVSIDVNPYNFL